MFTVDLLRNHSNKLGGLLTNENIHILNANHHVDLVLESISAWEYQHRWPASKSLQ